VVLSRHRALLDLPSFPTRRSSDLTLQFPFCYLATDRDIALVNLCKENNVGFISMKGLSGGLITNSAAAYAWQAEFDNALPIWGRSEEHTSELQSRFDLVCRLLLEK